MKEGMKWQVSSLELSKRLRDLGVKQESEFYWGCAEDHFTADPCRDEKHYRLQRIDVLEKGIAAFTVAELGEMLPFGCYTVISGAPLYFDCVYSGEVIKADTEADARAKMLIHLLESGLVKTEVGAW